MPNRRTTARPRWAAQADYWRKYVGLDGAVVGMTGFGASAPGGALLAHFGFTADQLAAAAEALLT